MRRVTKTKKAAKAKKPRKKASRKQTSRRLQRDRTCWLFIADSREPRHLRDIVYAVEILRRRGVPDTSIVVFTDHPAPNAHLHPYGIRAIHSLGKFKSVSSRLAGFTGAVVIATGHGCIDGIGGVSRVISPHALVSAVRSIPGIKVGVLILAQCYAGVFNFAAAKPQPPLVLVGATNLNASLSARYHLRSPILQQSGKAGFDFWVANIFLVKLFDWLAKPRDIDGDGGLTLMDAYKYAGTESNKMLLSLKGTLYVEVADMLEPIRALRATTPRPLLDEIRLQALQVELEQKLHMLYLHQESWILNANLARDIHID